MYDFSPFVTVKIPKSLNLFLNIKRERLQKQTCPLFRFVLTFMQCEINVM